METIDKVHLTFSTEFCEINSTQFKGWGVHLVCMSGEGSFEYNGKTLRIERNDAMVLTNPEMADNVQMTDDLQVVFVAAPFKFMYNQLPANNYGVGGCVSLFDNPIFHLTDDDARILVDDIYRIKQRMNETEHPFYNEMMGSLTLTMIYDLFAFHAKQNILTNTTDRTAFVVTELMNVLASGSCKTHREVSYYASQLNVTPKHLSDTVKRKTGRSVLQLIDQHTLPIVAEFLKNSSMSITQIADAMNFTSVAYFSRYVLKHFGMTPSQYREGISPTK